LVSSFRELSEQELSGLSPEELFSYARRARAMGDDISATAALRLLAYGLEPVVRAFVLVRIGDMDSQIVEEIVETAIFDAIRSAESFAGSTLAQFRAFAFTIARRRIDDHHRRDRIRHGDKERKVQLTPLEREGAEGEVLIHERPSEDPADAIAEASVFTQVLGGMDNDVHRAVVVLERFEDPPHAEIAERVNRQFGLSDDDLMREDNVAQICSRFRKRFGEALGDPGNGGADG
jgi:RNA polymerase sigma factor (sigma-70 family)